MKLLNHFKELISSALDRTGKNDHYYKVLADTLNIDSDSNYIFSTAEHLSPFNYASTVSNIYPLSVIHAALPELFDGIICMAGSLIPLDNEDYPRGVIGIDNNNQPVRINLKPQKVKKSFSLILDSTTVLPGEVERADYALKNILYDSAYKSTYAQQLIYIMTELYNIWKIPRNRPLPLRVYSLEEVALTILTELILNNDLIINSILFDPKIRTQLYRSLKNISCAWSDTNGTFLFWHSNNNKLHRMEEIDNNLVSSDYTVNLSPAALLEAIRKKELYPCVFLSLFCVSYLPGIPVTGGSNQFKYYQSMIYAMNNLNITCRSQDLSLYGYGTTDFTTFPINHKDFLPQQGAGVFLGLKETVIETVMKELGKRDVIL